MQGFVTQIASPDPRQFTLMRQLLDPRQFRQGVYQAVRRTTNAGKKIFQAVVLEMTFLNEKYVKRVITARMPSYDDPTGAVVISHAPIPIVGYDVVNIRGAGVAVMVSKNRAPIVFRHAFVSRLKSAAQTAQGSRGHVGVVYRARGVQGKSTPRGIAWRLPIREAKGPSVLSIVDRDDVSKVAMERLGDRFEKELGGQIDRFIKGIPPQASEAA